MIYGSVCSGIEAASVAWEPLGWRPSFFSEIEAFPSAVLAHHWPDVPNAGDFTKIEDGNYGPIDLLVGGTPCQSFSVAGRRLGLDDPRGNLSLEFVALARRLHAKRVVFENVPGLLSSAGGDDFAALISAFTGREYTCPENGWGNAGVAEGEPGWWGIAWRVLDAQYFGVPQRRRRVFVVGYIGDWRPAAAVLLEPESLCGNPPPRREAGQDVAGTLSARTKGSGGLGTDTELDGGLIASSGEVSHCLNAGGMGRQDFESETLIAHTLRGGGFDASEDGTGRGTPLIAVHGTQDPTTSDMAFPLGRNSGQETVVAFDMRGREGGAQIEGPHDTANIRAADGGSSRSYIAAPSVVRRLTPAECARLQGFPDDHCRIPWRGKPAEDCPDGPQYNAYGNSMCVPVMRWIGERIDFVDGVLSPAPRKAAG